MTEIDKLLKVVKEDLDMFQGTTQANILSLITTIESQQRDIQRIESENKGYLHSLKLKREQIESQKEEIEELKWKIAHPVSCSGICTSQLDDYCGMYMSNESCIACNAIWTNAHVENAVFIQKAITELKNNELSVKTGQLELAVKGLQKVLCVRHDGLISSEIFTGSVSTGQEKCQEIVNTTLAEIAKLSHE